MCRKFILFWGSNSHPSLHGVSTQGARQQCDSRYRRVWAGDGHELVRDGWNVVCNGRSAGRQCGIRNCLPVCFTPAPCNRFSILCGGQPMCEKL